MSNEGGLAGVVVVVGNSPDADGAEGGAIIGAGNE